MIIMMMIIINDNYHFEFPQFNSILVVFFLVLLFHSKETRNVTIFILSFIWPFYQWIMMMIFEKHVYNYYTIKFLLKMQKKSRKKKIL